MRQNQIFLLENPTEFVHKLLLWSQNFSEIAAYASCSFPSQLPLNFEMPNASFDFLIGVESLKSVQSADFEGLSSFEKVKQHLAIEKDWLLGYWGYDLKNEIENLTSSHFDGVTLPNLFFFQPRWVFTISANRLEISFIPSIDSASSIQSIFQDISSFPVKFNFSLTNTAIQRRISDRAYLDAIRDIKQLIQLGEIYQVNFCQEFYIEDVALQPIALFFKLIAYSPAPFACFLKIVSVYS